MRICCISDTHGQHKYLDKARHVSLPKADVLVHAGDTTTRGLEVETFAFINWMREQDYAHKVVIGGNHDAFYEKEPFQVAEYMAASGIHYLCDSACMIEGYKFYGSPYTTQFFDWHFMESEFDLLRRWDRIPEDTDVLVTHGPPYGIQDGNYHNEKCGSHSLMAHVKRVEPNLHIFGHIHAGRQWGGFRPVKEDGITFINAAFLNDSYDPYGIVQPVIDLDE